MTNKFQITYTARNLKDEEMKNYIAMFVEWAMKNYIVCLLYFSTNYVFNFLRGTTTLIRFPVMYSDTAYRNTTA